MNIQLIRWKLTRGVSIKINFDRSKSSSCAVAGFVIGNWQGGLVMSGSRFMEHPSIFVAEATTMRDAIQAALQAGFRRFEVEGDNQIVIKAMKVQINTPWQISPILQDIGT